MEERKRSQNLLEEDKMLLQELIKKRVKVLENKSTDTNTNSAKKRALLEVEDRELESSYPPADAETNHCCSQTENFETVSNNAITVSQCSKKNGESLFLKLSDDCLEIICKKLSIHDQINFALTCQRFFNIMTMISKIEHVYKTTNYFYCWYEESIKNVLRVVGSQIKHLEINDLPRKSILSDLSLFCKNVEKLTMDRNVLNTNSLMLLMNNMKVINELELNGSEIDINIFEYLKNYKYLKELSIKNNKILTGKNIYLLSDLQKLSIHKCHCLTSENIEQICTHLKKLHSLSLRDCFEITKKDLKNICSNLTQLNCLDIMYSGSLKPEDCDIISKNLLQLETLKLTYFNPDLLNFLSKFPKLNKLGLEIQSDKEDFLKNLSQFSGVQLEELHLHTTTMTEEVITALCEFKDLTILRIETDNIYDEYVILIAKLKRLEELKLALCYSITDKALLEILENCLKLKRLDLKCCDSLTDTFFEDAIILLKRQHAKRLRKYRISMSCIRTDDSNSYLKKIPFANSYPVLMDVSFLYLDEMGEFGNYEEIRDSSEDGSEDDYDFSDVWNDILG